MKVVIATNRVAELSAAQLYSILSDAFGGVEVRSVTVDGERFEGPQTVEVRWSEEPEERTI